MRKKKDKYYGIYFNDKIPKIDKINKYSKEVELKFEGEAYIIERDDDNEVVEKIELKNEDKLRKEKDYEIEFLNKNNEVFNLKVRIETNYLFLIILLFLLGFFIGLLLCKSTDFDNSPLKKFYDYINIAILQLDIDNAEEKVVNRKPKKQYDFDVTFDNISSDDLNLIDSISGKALAKNKIAPGVRGSFGINISTLKSSVDMSYKIQFEDITTDKPTNMVFKVRGSNHTYTTLKELENDLQGNIKKKSKMNIIIDWEWAYETGDDEKSIEENDLGDTIEGKQLQSYKFKINVIGEEVM